MRFSLEDLYPDPNSPGLRVCLKDLDDFDPYRLPARQTERINLPFNRPDVDLTGVGTPFEITEGLLITEAGVYLTTEDDIFLDVDRPGPIVTEGSPFSFLTTGDGDDIITEPVL